MLTMLSFSSPARKEAESFFIDAMRREGSHDHEPKVDQTDPDSRALALRSMTTPSSWLAGIHAVLQHR